MLTFAALVNDLPEGTSAAPVVDALLLALAGMTPPGIEPAPGRSITRPWPA
jgi:hypothetical protein